MVVVRHPVHVPVCRIWHLAEHLGLAWRYQKVEWERPLVCSDGRQWVASLAGELRHVLEALAGAPDRVNLAALKQVFCMVVDLPGLVFEAALAAREQDAVQVFHLCKGLFLRFGH